MKRLNRRGWGGRAGALALAVLMVAACAPRDAAVESASERSPGQAEIASAAAAGAQAATAAAEAGEAPEEAVEEGPMARWQEPAPQPAPAPEDVMEVLAALGWEVASPLQTEAFAPMPPGAEARAARMRRGSEEMGVAVFRYPNPGFALPHVVDLRERIAVLPHPREAVVRAGRTVVHLEGPDGARVASWARQVADRLEVELAPEDVPGSAR